MFRSSSSSSSSSFVPSQPEIKAKIKIEPNKIDLLCFPLFDVCSNMPRFETKNMWKSNFQMCPFDNILFICLCSLNRQSSIGIRTDTLKRHHITHTLHWITIILFLVLIIINSVSIATRSIKHPFLCAETNYILKIFFFFDSFSSSFIFYNSKWKKSSLIIEIILCVCVCLFVSQIVRSPLRIVFGAGLRWYHIGFLFDLYSLCFHFFLSFPDYLALNLYRSTYSILLRFEERSHTHTHTHLTVQIQTNIQSIRLLSIRIMWKWHFFYFKLNYCLKKEKKTKTTTEDSIRRIQRAWLSIFSEAIKIQNKSVCVDMCVWVECWR